MSVSIHRLASHDLDSAAAEALEICRLHQLAIESRRRNFEQITCAGHRVFYVENRSQFATVISAIFVRHAGQLVPTRRRGNLFASFGRRGQLLLQRAASFGILLYKDPQSASLTA